MSQTKPATEPRTEQKYWRSLEQLEDPAAFAAKHADEFAAGASEPPALDDVSRRNFLGIVAASPAVAGMTSCRKPITNIMPFGVRPEDLVPGNPLYYATAHIHDGVGTGILVRSSDGRPTKVEGNPVHPSSLGGSNHLMQAELLNLYDPLRSQHPVRDTDRHEETPATADDGHGSEASTHATIADFAHFWADQDLGDGSGVRLLLEPTSSPTIQAALARFRAKYPNAGVHFWAPVNRSAALEATKSIFGSALETRYDLTKADVVVSFDCDFQSQDGDSVRNARDYAGRRKITSETSAADLSRLYVIEGYHSVTGSNADHRLRVRSQEVGDVVMALAAQLESAHGLSIEGDYSGYAELAQTLSYNGKPFVPALAKDLADNRGRSALVIGPRLPSHAQAILHALNQALGNTNQTVSYVPTPQGLTADTNASIAELVSAIDAGSVNHLVMLGGNPVYTAPVDLDLRAKLSQVAATVNLSLLDDETGHLCTWHVNQAHDLEAWGDILSHDGTATVVQPLIMPLYDGISILEMIALLTDGLQDDKLPNGYDLVRNYWQTRASGSFETWWARALHDGVVESTAAAAVSSVTPNGSAVAAAANELQPAASGSVDNLEVQFRPAYNLHDGRYSNNSWLMELPDPMTKITWDNAALISLGTLEELGLEQGEIAEISLDGRTVEAPVWVLPGHADYSITLTLGYGRAMDEKFVTPQGAGFDAYALRSAANQNTAAGAKVRGTGRHYNLSLTQEHGTMEGRNLVRENTAQGYVSDPAFAPDANPLAKAADVYNQTHKDDEDFTEKQAADLNKSLWDPSDLPEDHDYSKGYQWGMVIDLNSCTGCNACVSACVSENNIAMVGKEEIASGRDMFWNRIDRYFGSETSGDFEHEGLSPEFNAIPETSNPQVVHQMVPCMQCENASCEVVCPVAATTHSPEGLNDMAYNRCIGTRYCGNNCPYKVRHFNYLDYHGEVAETIKMTRNPDVTVRSRGVMEKCTYCVQRISRKKIEAKREDRRTLEDGEIKTACEQSCPTQAITFGDINDESSRVSTLKRSNLNYALLGELNMKPRTTYLAKIRNPNPELTAG